MNIETKFKEVVKEANRLKDVRKVRTQALADRMGLRKTSMYTLLRGELHRKNGSRNFADALINKMHSEICQASTPVETTTFKFLKNIATGVQSQGLMVCTTGRPGVGKSTALKYVSNSQENTYYILCNHLDSPEDFIGKIHSSLGLKEIIAKGKKKRKLMIEAIITFVYEQDSIPLLILDDIHHLGLSVYQDLKVLFDGTEGMLGIMLVGTPTLEVNLKKWAGYDIDWKEKFKPRAIMPELVRRFKGNFYPIPELQTSDLKAICEKYGVNDARIAKHYIKLPHFELGMFTDKLEKASQMESENIDLDLLLSI